MSVLSPSVIAGIEDLEVAARVVVEGLRAGSHRSPFHGYSAEFQQHRPYRAGDDLKYLDWKILARTDRLYTRQFRETTSMSVMLVLDASASMDYPQGALTKFRYACVMAAAVAWLVSSQGDAVGLISAADGKLNYLPSRGGRPHLRSLIAAIDNLRPGGSWDPAGVIARGSELLKRRGVIVVISDFYDAWERTSRELRRCITRGHDASMLQLLAREEFDFPFVGNTLFEDAETGARVLTDAPRIRESYRDALLGYLRECRLTAQRDGVDYTLASTATPPDRVLRGWLLRRGEGSTVERAVEGAT